MIQVREDLWQIVDNWHKKTEGSTESQVAIIALRALRALDALEYEVASIKHKQKQKNKFIQVMLSPIDEDDDDE